MARHLQVAPEDIHIDSKATDFPAWDSLRHLIMMMEIEQSLGFKFELEELAKLDSVQRIMQAVQDQTSPSKEGPTTLE